MYYNIEQLLLYYYNTYYVTPPSTECSLRLFISYMEWYVLQNQSPSSMRVLYMVLVTYCGIHLIPGCLSNGRD